MTEATPPPLTYDSSRILPNSRTRTAAWIMLFVLGILTDLGGICMGASTAAMFALFIPRAGPPRPGAAAPNWGLVVTVVALVYVVLPVGIGSTEIVCALKVRRRSRAATITALVLTLIQLLLALGLIGFGIVAATGAGPDKEGIIPAIVFIALSAVVFAIASWLLFRTRSESA
ncbi:MAG: hypothetical protein ACTHN5_04055 [Phycisphaerae bacterium]